MIVQRLVPFLLAFVLGLGAAALAACGTKENPHMLPAANADELKNDLDDVLAAIASEDCSDAAAAIDQADADIASLPSEVSVGLREELDRGVARLKEQAAEECEGEDDDTETTTTETETVPTITEPPVTEPHVEPPVTEPPVTEPPVTEPPAAEPPDDGVPPNGNGNGNGPPGTDDTGGVVVPE